jgi:uncharacterized protein involved in outer membrane biogenesis
MKTRRWLCAGAVVLLLAAAGLRVALPELIRLAVIARVQAMTGRAASLDGVDIAVRRGYIALRGFRLADRAGEAAPFVQFSQLDLQLRWFPLLRGHVSLREMVLRDPLVQVIRYPGGEFNLSDLVRQSGGTRRVLDVTIDRFVLVNGTTTLEDRAVPEPRTWRSERVAIEAHNLSSRPQYGSAVATSVTGGAPVSVRVERLRLYPIDLQAMVTVDAIDLALARIYLPANAPVTVDQGHASTTLHVAVDAHDGLRLDGTARLEDLVLTRSDGGALARLPTLTATLDGLRFAPGGLAMAGLAVDGSGTVVDPSAGSAVRFVPTTVRARLRDLTWPVTQPAGLEVATRVQGHGTLSVDGTLHPPSAPSQVRLRLADFDLAPWARFVPLAAQLTGVAEADLRINEPLRAGVPSRVRGTIAVSNAAISDGSTRLVEAQRVEAAGLEVDWPARVKVGRLTIREPRAVVERGPAGDFPAARLLSPAGGSNAAATASANIGVARPSRPSLAIDVSEVMVQDGRVEWRDRAAAPVVRAALSALTGTVTGVSWPLRGPLEVRLAGHPTGGGQLEVAGRVGVAPFIADTRVTARAVDLAPYQPYLGVPVQLRAWTDFDLAVAMPGGDALATARGRAALSGVDVRDGERTVLHIERAAATGLDVEWPRRVAVAQLELEAPWFLVERDPQGVMAIRALLPPQAGGAASADRSAPDEKARSSPSLAATVALLTVKDGGARIVDESIAPKFALDLRRVALRAEGISTPPGRPVHVDLTGQAGPGTVLALRGTVGPVGGPLDFDLRGELRGLDAVRTNPYVMRYVAWQAAQGLLAVRVEGRLQDDALDARADIQLSRLQVVPAAPGDGASNVGAGLPLNIVVALMRDRRGDIRMSLPVSGRLSDPHFDFREAIRSAIKTVAINTITLPVSWIGRLHVSADSTIENVEVDPIRFQPGSVLLTEAGRAQAQRVAAFLDQVGEVRMALTPTVSERDLAVLRHQAAETSIKRRAAEARIPPEDAAAKLLRERRPDRPVPAEWEALLDALAETEAAPTQAPSLAVRRLDTLLAVFKEAGIPRARLAETPLAERPEANGGAVELNLLEPETTRRSQLLQTLQKLGGTAPAESD